MTGTPGKTILHADMDAFFAAVEQRDNPALRGKPVIVGGGGPTDRGVVSTASYEARKFGVRSAMPLRTAAALCPNGIFVPVNGHKYSEASRQVMAIFRRFSPLVEPLSIDEAFLDLTGTEQLLGSGEEAAKQLKQAVRDGTELTVSVGVASNRLVAKIASDLRKPDGLVVVPRGEEAEFLAPLAIERLWGVGASTRRTLAEFGVATIGDLARLPEDVLSSSVWEARARHRAAITWYWRNGSRQYRRGQIRQPRAHVRCRHRAIGRCLNRPCWPSARSRGRLRSTNVLAATVSVKIRNSSFETITRQRTLAQPTDMGDVIWRTAVELARREVRGQRIRLLGVAASGLGEQRQLGLFEGGEDRRRRATEAADAVRKKYGSKAIRRARLLDAGVRAPFERDPRRLPIVNPDRPQDE